MCPRGPHPKDAADFGPDAVEALRSAVVDLSWLLGRGYADVAALKLVGDRFQLSKRQRAAVRRGACSDDELDQRRKRQLEPTAIADQHVLVDGFNVLILVERAIGGGAVHLGRDGVLRDVGGVHGTYRLNEQTDEALRAVGSWLAEHTVAQVTWLLDQPVSNSGRLAARIRDVGTTNGWPWTAEVVRSPDHELIEREGIAATSDGGVLDRCGPWVNLAAEVVAAHGDSHPLQL